MFATQAPWHNDIVMEFIELYRTEPMLWDPKHNAHKNKPQLNGAWERIREAMSIECTVVDLKKKKESLMTAYRLHNRRRLNNPEYQTSWFAFDCMDSFLGDVYRNVEMPSITDNELSNSEDHQYTLLEQSRTIKQEKPSSSSTPKYHRKRKRPIEVTYSDSSERETRDTEDECELYGRLLAKKMRKLDERQREIVMHEIDNVMFCAIINSKPQKNQNSKNTSSSNFRKFKTPPESPVFIETEEKEEYEEEYLEDPMQEA